jgi:predicted ester cyclase
MDGSTFVKEMIHEIWNRKQIGRIYDAYQHNAVAHGSDGDLYGREAILRATIWRLAALPDAHAEIEGVIAGGDRVSLRWTLSGRNTGHSIYGPPTGREVSVRNLSWFTLRDGRVVEERRATDELGVIRAMGLDPKALAGTLAAPSLDEIPPAYGIGAIERVAGQTTPQPLLPAPAGSFDVEDFLHRSMHRIWNWRLLGEVEAVCGDEFICHGPAGREIEGREAYQGTILATLGAFPDLMVCLDDLIWEGDGREGYRAAARWTALGTHEGPGDLGGPTGKRVQLCGISHFTIRDGRVVEEWHEHNEFALLKQLYVPPEQVGEGAADDRQETGEE